MLQAPSSDRRFQEQPLRVSTSSRSQLYPATSNLFSISTVRGWRGERQCAQYLIAPPPGLSPLVEQVGCFAQSGSHFACLRADETVSFQSAL